MGMVCHVISEVTIFKKHDIKYLIDSDLFMCGFSCLTGVLGKLTLFPFNSTLLFAACDTFCACVEGPFFLGINLWFPWIFFALQTRLRLLGSTVLMAFFPLF